MANVEELLIKLTADNKDLKNKLNQSEKDVKGFSSNMTKIGTAAVAAFAVAGAAVLAFGVAGFKAAQQQEQANKRLLFALKGNTVAFKELAGQAEKLRSETGVDDAAIMQIQQLGANAGYSTDKIKKITKATVELAAVTGQDLQAAYMQINATYNGTAGRLTRLDAEFGTLTEEQLRNGDAVDLIINKYGGLAAESATEIQKLSSNWDEFTERLGAVTLPAINAFFAEVNTNMRIMSDDSLTWWEKLTIPAEVYRDIEKQKKALDDAGKNATNYYRSVLGINNVAGALNSNKSKAAGKKPAGKAKEEKDPFLMMPEEIQGSLDGLVQYITQASAFEDSYRLEVENGTQEMLATNEDAYTNFYSNLLSKKTQYALASEAIDNQLTEAQMQGIYDTLGMAASLFKEHTAAYKLFASAQAAMDTYKAANASYASLAGIPVVGPALGAIAAGVAVASGLANVAKINGIAFADGGIVSGPTNALIGEYAGARSNPEVVAPLDKLRSIMGGNMQRVEVYGYLDGDVIRLANKRSNYIADRRG